MTVQHKTPYEILASMLKSECGMTNLDTAQILLSSHPSFDGRSAVQRASEKTWLLRYIVHAEPPYLNPDLFADLELSVPRLVSRMKGKRSRGRSPLTNADIVRLVAERYVSPMAQAVAAYGRDETLFANAVARIACDGDIADSDKAEQIMALMVWAAISADGAAAVREMEHFSTAINAPSPLTPPRTTPLIDIIPPERSDGAFTLGLVRLKGGMLCGDTVWLHPDGDGALVSSMRASDPEGNATVINNVEADVSSMHARIRYSSADGWTVVGLGSRNGTVVRRATGSQTVVVEPPRDETPGDSSATAGEAAPVPILPGDTIVFASSTVYCVLAHPSIGRVNIR